MAYEYSADRSSLSFRQDMTALLENCGFTNTDRHAVDRRRGFPSTKGPARSCENPPPMPAREAALELAPPPAGRRAHGTICWRLRARSVLGHPPRTMIIATSAVPSRCWSFSRSHEGARLRRGDRQTRRPPRGCTSAHDGSYKTARRPESVTFSTPAGGREAPGFTSKTGGGGLFRSAGNPARFMTTCGGLPDLKAG